MFLTGANRSAIACCGAERHPECFALELKSNDPFYKEKGLMCMDFVRSAPAPICQIGKFVNYRIGLFEKLMSGRFEI